MDTDIGDVNNAKAVIHHYEWAITDGVNDARIINKWSIVDIATTSDEKVYQLLLICYMLLFFLKTFSNNLKLSSKTGLQDINGGYRLLDQE